MNYAIFGIKSSIENDLFQILKYLQMSKTFFLICVRMISTDDEGEAPVTKRKHISISGVNHRNPVQRSGKAIKINTEQGNFHNDFLTLL